MTSSGTQDTSQNSSVATLPDSSSGSAMVTWLKAQDSQGTNNKQKLDKVEKDIVKMDDDASKHADFVLDGACEALGFDSGSFVNAQSPDATVNTNLANGATSFQDASTNCALDDKALTAAFNSGVTSFNIAIARINSDLKSH